MTTIREAVRRIFTPVKPLPPGIYHYQAPPEDPRNYRLHLRLESDGKGVLIVNASTVLHLSQTAAEYAYHLVNQTHEEKVAQSLASRYRVSRAQATQDFRDFVDRIDTLVTTPDLDPVTFLDFDRITPYTGEISAPYRLDCALTYQLPVGANPEAAPTKRVTRELTTEEWQLVLDKAWEFGIPHIIFTGGEPTLREDLIPLLTHAEAIGQVTGLLTDGLRLAHQEYFNEVLQTGIDHLMIVMDPEQKAVWTALENALRSDLFTAIHLTITSNNVVSVQGLLERLAEMKISAVSLSANSKQMGDELQSTRRLAASLNLPIVWDVPVPYSDINPVALELENHETTEGFGRVWLYVEPDGDVLPRQGINKVLGNILRDAWEEIWKS